MARGGNPLSVDVRKNRSYLLYGFSIVVMVIIGVSMIGTLAPTGLDGAQPASVFGTFDGQEISFSPTNYLGAAYRWHYRDLSSRLPEDTDRRQLLYQVWQRAYRDALMHAAQVRAAAAGGVHVSQQGVDRSFIESVAAYEDLAEMPVTTRAGNLERVREVMTRQRYVDDLTGGRLSSAAEVAFYEEMIGRERRFEFVSFTDGSYPDAEAAAYGEANAADFRRIDVSRIELRSADAAAQVRERILSETATFEDQARAHSQDPYRDQGGDVGFQYFHQLSGDFADPQAAEQVFALARDDVSEVLAGRQDDVFYLYRANSPVIEPDFADADTVAAVRAYLLTQERGRVEDYVLAQGDRFVVAASQSDFHAAAAEAGLTVHATEWFPINFRNAASWRPVAAADGQPLLSGAAEFEEFFRQGFALQRAGDVSAPIRLPDGVVVLRLLEERQAAPEDLQTVAGGSVFEWFTAQALNADLEQWIGASGLWQDNFGPAFAATIANTGG